MKKHITHKIIFSLLFTTLLTTAPSAHALDLPGFFNSVQRAAQEALEAQQRRAENARENSKENPRVKSFPASSEEVVIGAVSNSLVKIKGATPPGMNWLLVTITKTGEQVERNRFTFSISDDSYDSLVAIKDGAGNYDVKVFAKNDVTVAGAGFRYLVTYKVRNTDTRDMSYLLPTSMVQSENAEIKELAQRITVGATSQKEIVTLIHDYVITTVKYNVKGYEDKSFLNNPYDALSILNNPVTVCAGYSNFFAALVRASGIRVKVINGPALLGPGRSEEHAWNEVLINGRWEIVDSTWGVGRSDDKYFLADPKIFAIDHTKTKELEY